MGDWTAETMGPQDGWERALHKRPGISFERVKWAMKGTMAFP